MGFWRRGKRGVSEALVVGWGRRLGINEWGDGDVGAMRTYGDDALG